MKIDDVKKSFAGHRHGMGTESHSLKSLSKRVLVSRATLSKAIRQGELKFSAKIPTSQGHRYEFSSTYLDDTRSAVVSEIVDEITARLQGLDASEQEQVLAALHGMRGHVKDIEETEFARPYSPNDEENDSTGEVSKLIGTGVGAFGGARLGSRFGLPGLVGGAIVGGGVGDEIAGNRKSRDLAGAAGLGAGGILGHQAIQRAGGYQAVGRQVGGKLRAAAPEAINAAQAGGAMVRTRILDALRKAAKMAKI